MILLSPQVFHFSFRTDVLEEQLFKPLQFVSAANLSAYVMFQVLDEMFLLENYFFTEMLPPFLLPPSFLPACHLW